jgi:hypothetical protein
MRFAAALGVSAVLVLGAAACGSDSHPAVLSPAYVNSADSSSDQTSATDVARWVANWCAVRIGMKTGDAERLMGRPTKGTEGSLGTLVWTGRGYGLIAGTKDGRIITLYDAGRSGEQPALPCPAIR